MNRSRRAGELGRRLESELLVRAVRILVCKVVWLWSVDGGRGCARNIGPNPWGDTFVSGAFYSFTEMLKMKITQIQTTEHKQTIRQEKEEERAERGIWLEDSKKKS